jgi:hypothetical protein
MSFDVICCVEMACRTIVLLPVFVVVLEGLIPEGKHLDYRKFPSDPG